MVRSTNDLSQRYPSPSRRNAMQSPNKKLATPKARPIQTMDSNKKYIFPRICRRARSDFAPALMCSLKAKTLPYGSWTAAIELQCGISLQNKQILVSHTLRERPRATFQRNPQSAEWRKLVTGVGHSPRPTHPANAAALSRPQAIPNLNSKRAILAARLRFLYRGGWSSPGLRPILGEEQLSKIRQVGNPQRPYPLGVLESLSALSRGAITPLTSKISKTRPADCSLESRAVSRLVLLSLDSATLAAGCVVKESNVRCGVA